MQRLKIAIVTPGYPSNENGGFGFVHARAKLYAPKNEVKVFTISSKNSSSLSTLISFAASTHA